MKNRGVLLFAFNNERMDYMRLAKYCASRIRRVWKLPVTLITEPLAYANKADYDDVIRITKSKSPNLRIYPDYSESLSFYNKDRMLAWQLSPYDETIVIDTDYIPGNDVLPRYWSGQSLLVSKTAHSLSDQPIPDYLRFLSPKSVPMYWATVLMFDRSPMAKRFFSEWMDAANNYEHYANLFGFDPSLYRNDHAVTVAINKMLNGTQSDALSLPFSIPTALPDLQVLKVDPIHLSNNVGKVFYDVHVMHKKSLLEAICALEGF